MATKLVIAFFPFDVFIKHFNFVDHHLKLHYIDYHMRNAKFLLGKLQFLTMESEEK